jgi:hypothetical protein
VGCFVAVDGRRSVLVDVATDGNARSGTGQRMSFTGFTRLHMIYMIILIIL